MFHYKQPFSEVMNLPISEALRLDRDLVRYNARNQLQEIQTLEIALAGLFGSPQKKIIRTLQLDAGYNKVKDKDQPRSLFFKD